MRPLRVPTPACAWRTLVDGAVGTVEIALDPGGYVRFGEAWVLIAVPRAPRGPLSLLVPGLHDAPLQAGDRAEVRDGVLRVGAHAVRLAPPGCRAAAARPAAAGWRAALDAALGAVPAPPASLTAGLSALRTDLEAGVAKLAGRGEGLTPAGDDVLTGYAAWTSTRLSHLAARASPLGRAYIECAERGELPEPAERVLQAIRAGDPQAARRRARNLSQWGSSSGHAILWGMGAAA